VSENINLKFTPLQTEEAKKHLEKMPCVYPKGFCTVGPFGYVIAADMAPQFHEFIEFAPRSDDIWVCGFPRSGMDGFHTS